jgi:hypothetical protein
VRRLTFLAILSATAIAVLVTGSSREGIGVSPLGARATAHRRTASNSPSGTRGLGRDAHRFIEAFLVHEAGQDDPATRAALISGAGARLAHEILAGPDGSGVPRPNRRPPALSLHATRLPHRPDLALATGTAHRASGPERFAFLFAHRDGRWLAIAPAE